MQQIQLEASKAKHRIWEKYFPAWAKILCCAQKRKPHPFVVANRMVRGSYVSLQSALAYYGLIPEVVPVVTSVTTARPDCWETPLRPYEFRLKAGAEERGAKGALLDARIRGALSCKVVRRG